jgi:flagellar protein FlaI
MVMGNESRTLEENVHAEILAGWPYPQYILKRKAWSPAEYELKQAIIDVLNKKNSIVYISFKHLDPEYEQLFKEKFRDEVLLKIPPQAFSKLPKEEERKQIVGILGAYLSNFPISDVKRMAEEIVNEVFGLGEIEELLADDELEEIMVNGENRPIFVYHRKHGMCKTDIMLSREAIIRCIKRVATWANRKISEKNPLLDAHLPNGDRFNATIPPISLRGPTITIRKFKQVPFILTDIINNGTLPVNVAAFLWVAVEGFGVAPRNILIAGGAGAGKTTTLNALLDFVPLDQRIITVEDTKELDLPMHENWIPLVTRPPTQDSSAVTMNDLLKNALRMRPDRIIVGEVRGEEAETLFVAMDVGHQGTMGTLHANSAREVLIRLRSAPMNVPEDLLPLMNLILVQHRIRTPNGMVRRVMELAEVARMDDKVLLSDIFRWDPRQGKIVRTDVPAHTIDEMSEITGVPKQKILEEITRREAVLRWACKHVKSRQELIKLISAYYTDPEGVYNAIS